MKFEAFPKIPRLMRDITITEKIDGTNGQIYFMEKEPSGVMPELALADLGTAWLFAGSRQRWVTLEEDNFGFARWVYEYGAELYEGLGAGRHYGEWWGLGIQRNYGRDEKRFSLFNTGRWVDWSYERTEVEIDAGKLQHAPECCHVVPVLYEGLFTSDDIDNTAEKLHRNGSSAAPGFMQPEGIVVWHHAARVSMKWTFGGDGHKS